MGLCPSNSQLPKGMDKEKFAELKKASKNVDQGAKMRANEDSTVKKLLLLGAGESGKSTLFKQMISIYGDGFSPEELKAHRKVVHNNCLVHIRILMKALDDFKEVQEDAPLSPEAEAAIEAINEYADTRLDGEIAGHIKTLWLEPAFQNLWTIRSEFQISDSAEYFFNKIDEIAAPDYVPTEQDLIQSRVRTTGIVQTKFTIEDVKFHMFDVGGQRNERKKWIHCFESVTIVIFVAAISEYDQKLFEDNETSRITEALNLFADICNSRWFQDTNIILFLNKKDLFAEKIKVKPLSQFFDDYKGEDDDIEAGHKFFIDMFLARRKGKDKTIYTHVTCATERENVNHVFNSVMHTVIQAKMKGGGIL